MPGGWSSEQPPSTSASSLNREGSWSCVSCDKCHFGPPQGEGASAQAGCEQRFCGAVPCCWREGLKFRHETNFGGVYVMGMIRYHEGFCRTKSNFLKPRLYLPIQISCICVFPLSDGFLDSMCRPTTLTLDAIRCRCEFLANVPMAVS